MKTKVILIISLVIIITVIITNLKEKPGIKLKEESKAFIYRANGFKSPQPDYLKVNRLENDTVYFDIDLATAKKELNTEKIFLITTFNGKPREIKNDSFKVNLYEHFNFITGFGFEKFKIKNDGFPNGSVIRCWLIDGSAAL